MANVKLLMVLRWTFLLGALIGAAALVFWPQENEVRVPQIHDKATPPRAPSAVTPPAIASPPASTSDELTETTPEIRDPFTPRGWMAQPEPVAPPPPPRVESAPTPLVQESVGPPALPYRYMGQMDDGGAKVVYLSRGNDTFVVHPGDLLESTYKVLAMDARQIEFEHIPTGTKQVLAIPISE